MQDPCVNDVNMSVDAKYGFIELRAASETTAALALDGLQLMGRPLKVSRPNDFVEAPPALANVMIPPAVSAAVTSSNMPSGGMGSILLGGLGSMAPNPNRPNQNPMLQSGSMMHAATMPTISALPGAAAAAAALATSGAAAGVAGLPPPPPVAGLPLPTVNPLHAALAAGAPVPPGQNLMSISRRARRLHVGNLPLGVGLTAEMLKQFFNAALVSATLHDPSLPDGEPVLDAMLGTEGKFGKPAARDVPSRVRLGEAS